MICFSCIDHFSVVMNLKCHNAYLLLFVIHLTAMISLVVQNHTKMGKFILVVYYRCHVESKSTWQFCQETLWCRDMLVHILVHLTIFATWRISGNRTMPEEEPCKHSSRLRGGRLHQTEIQWPCGDAALQVFRVRHKGASRVQDALQVIRVTPGTATVPYA